MVTSHNLEEYKNEMVNTQKGRTFGGILTGDNFKPVGNSTGTYVKTGYKAWKLQSRKPAERHTVKLYSYLAQTETLEEWKKGLDTLVSAKKPYDKSAKRETREWWKAFWQKSWFVLNHENPDPQSKTWQLGRNYQLFRYQMGCNYYGTYPTKFNGGNFTYDPYLIKSHSLHGMNRVIPFPYNPDWRLWGGGSFTAQNQRLLYWPLLKSGDFDMMPAQFDYYNRSLPNATARVKKYWGHKGCLYAEQLENFGLPVGSQWKYPVSTPEKPVVADPKADHHYAGQLEFAYMILEYHRFSGKDISKYMDFIKNSVIFFDEHYQAQHKLDTGKPLDENGKLIIYPSTGCESVRQAKNPGIVVAGLTACIEGLLALPPKYVKKEEREYFKGFLNRIPGYQYEEVKGDKTVKVAWSWGFSQPDECPHFYPLFPFDQFALGTDDMTVWRNTWKHGKFWKNVVVSWHQDGIFYARMGMIEDAAKYNTRKMEDSPRRFPTFWGPGNDWVPDHNWGGSGMIGLQEMLMQTIGKKILLLPAWPKEWDVDFKLHAPENTIVEGKVRSGNVTELNVTPKERLKDVVIAGK
jgi:hypothetical protein